MPSGPDPLTAQQVAAALRSGNRAEAEFILRRRLLQAPHDATALAALAEIATANGDLADATAVLTRALTLVPAAHPLRLRLATLHQRQSNFPLALDLLQQVPAELRQSFELKAQEADLLGQVGRRDEEIAIYRALLRQQPRNAVLWNSLGNALNYAGDSAEAVKALRKATKIAPSYGEPWWGLANLKRFRFDDRDLAAMRSALERGPGTGDALHFHFALGRAFEQRGRYRESFDHYAEGNRLRGVSLRPEQTVVTRLVDQAIATFTPALFERYAGAGCPDEGPIFVLGLHRSGSTLIEQILASHPDIEGTAELVTMQNLSDELAALARRNGCSLFEQIAQSDASAFRQIGEQYLARTKSYRREGKRFFVDKLPGNWLNIGLIRLALPNAKIIDARRHPLACGFSNFKQHYATGVHHAYGLESIGLYYRDYLWLMRHFDAVQPGAVLHVLNEQLIEEPETEVRRMLDHIGLPFDRSCLEFHANKRAVHTPSAEQVRRPINREGVDAWRNYEPWLGPLRDALGAAVEEWRE